jgi:CheY-like chemotaxis protein
MGTRVAVSVDEVRGERGAAVLGLPQGLGGEAYEGAFLEPDGSLLLVLRPDWLVRQVGAQRAIVGTRRILVVDDSISARALHRAILEAAGFTVHAVESSGTALALLEQNAYDAVVTDIHMPDHDGLWLTAQIRADARLRKLPVFVLSADDTEENRLHVRQVGGTAFLAKADSRSGRLVETIREAIGSAA